MNGFFGKLHWRMPMQSTPTHRWTTWARSLSAGRRRIFSRHLAAIMQLLRPAIPIHRSSHRWELHAWSLFPRINLVVRPVLQHFADKGASGERGTASRSSSAFKLRKDSLTGVRAQGFLKRRNLVEANGLAELNPASESTHAPLNRVFRRLLTTDIQTEYHHLITKESVKVARRVIAEAKRVERYGPTAMVTKQDAIARRNLENTRGSETKLQEQLSELSKAVPDMMHGKAPFAATVNGLTIEQLTEQVMRRIDDQIVAHKERMGKVF
jgi:hypothetical protein